MTDAEFSNAILALVGASVDSPALPASTVATIASFMVIGMKVALNQPEWAAAVVEVAARNDSMPDATNEAIKAIVEKYPATKEAHG